MIFFFMVGDTLGWISLYHGEKISRSSQDWAKTGGKKLTCFKQVQELELLRSIYSTKSYLWNFGTAQWLTLELPNSSLRRWTWSFAFKRTWLTNKLLIFFLYQSGHDHFMKWCSKGKNQHKFFNEHFYGFHLWQGWGPELRHSKLSLGW